MRKYKSSSSWGSSSNAIDILIKEGIIQRDVQDPHLYNVIGTIPFNKHFEGGTPLYVDWGFEWKNIRKVEYGAPEADQFGDVLLTEHVGPSLGYYQFDPEFRDSGTRTLKLLLEEGFLKEAEVDGKQLEGVYSLVQELPVEIDGISVKLYPTLGEIVYLAGDTDMYARLLYVTQLDFDLDKSI